MFAKVLVANRATVASRVIRTLDRLGVPSVAVYSEADRDLPYVAQAGQAQALGAAPAVHSYLDIERVVAVARACGADAVHPGYGFLSENVAFARACAAAGLAFIGPGAAAMSTVAHKRTAREAMAPLGMPMAPSSGLLPEDDEDAAVRAALQVGFPLMLKPASGGGGIGMQACYDEAGLRAALAQARRVAARAFGDGGLYAERLLQQPRHVEFQIVADRHGDAMHLFERDCSVQRRHQKVIEEAPAPGLDRAAVDAFAARAVHSLRTLGYDHIGTVETLHEAALGFRFLEVNARLQVEHAVTEQITGVDLVEIQLRLAAGERLAAVLPQPPVCSGHAIQARVYAEDPQRFLPSPGPLQRFRPPSLPGVRVEAGYREGNTVTPYYDPMLAKVVATAPTREQARALLVRALHEFEIEGVRHNLPFLHEVLESGAFRTGAVHTGLVPQLRAASPCTKEAIA